MDFSTEQAKERLTPISRIEEWVLGNIHRPIKGFEHKKNKDGSFYSFAQQMRATRSQIMAVAHYLLERGKSTEEVRGVLAHFR